MSFSKSPGEAITLSRLTFTSYRNVHHYQFQEKKALDLYACLLNQFLIRRIFQCRCSTPTWRFCNMWSSPMLKNTQQVSADGNKLPSCLTCFMQLQIWHEKNFAEMTCRIVRADLYDLKGRSCLLFRETPLQVMLDRGPTTFQLFKFCWATAWRSLRQSAGS